MPYDSRAKKLCVLMLQQYLAAEEEEYILSDRRERIHDMYLRREDEGAYNILIKKHLLPGSVKFKEFFRVTPDQFALLLSLVENKLTVSSTNRVSKPICAAQKLALTLRYLATGESFRSLQFSHRISVSSICKFVPLVLKALKEALLPKFLPPPDQIDWKKKTDEFWTNWSFPNAVAAMDGKHIRMAPDNKGTLPIDCKGYSSTVLLAMVDANCKFLIVDMGSYGKEGDAVIFNTSKIGLLVKSESIFPPPQLLPQSNILLPHVLLCDNAFRLDEHIMQPYCKQEVLEDVHKRKFNNQLNKARNVTENAFGILCSTFRIFLTSMNVKPETVDLIVLVTCCLHNFLRDEHQSMQLASFAAGQKLNYENPRNNMIPLVEAKDFANASGLTVRKRFTEYFNGPNFDHPS